VRRAFRSSCSTGPIHSGFRNFECQWDIPYVYGLTPGELAYMIVGSHGWIKAKPALTIVPMKGWRRSMYWNDTGLIWIPTSPHIPTPETALNYIATGFLGEAGGVNHGIGYTVPFDVVGHPSFNSFELTDEFNRIGLPGVLFHAATWEPFYGTFKNKVCNGVQIFYTDRDEVNLCNLAVQILYHVYHKPGIRMFQPDATGESGPQAFDAIAGGSALRTALQAGRTPSEITATWQDGLDEFRRDRQRYLIYHDSSEAKPEVSPPHDANFSPPAPAAIPSAHQAPTD
jgi:uncharacterized protein YbbC (DUF1343 family)